MFQKKTISKGTAAAGIDDTVMPAAAVFYDRCATG